MAQSIISSSIIGDERAPLGVTLSVAGVGDITLRLSDISADIATRAMLHGLVQKVSDAAAIARNPDTGRSATPQDKFDAMREVADRLLSGQWNKTREGGGAANGTLLVQALFRFYNGEKTLEALASFVKAKTPEQQRALAANPRIAPIIAAIRAERGAAQGSDDLLGELDAL